MLGVTTKKMPDNEKISSTPFVVFSLQSTSSNIPNFFMVNLLFCTIFFIFLNLACGIMSLVLSEIFVCVQHECNYFTALKCGGFFAWRSTGLYLFIDKHMVIFCVTVVVARGLSGVYTFGEYWLPTVLDLSNLRLF